MQPRSSNRFASFSFIIFLIALMWSGFIMQGLYPELTNYGLIPRTLIGLRGVVFSPFLHDNFTHIFSNTIGLLIFGVIYTIFEGKQPVRLIFWMTLYSGIAHWIVGTSSIHIGMSGVIFGLYGFLLSVGFFHKKPKYIVLSAAILIFYSYMLIDLLPLDAEMSWTGHLTGFLTGIVIAKYKEN